MTPLFPGPKYVGPQAERYRVADEPSVDASVDYCSGCGICTQVCPQGVKIAEINAQARNKLKQQKGVPLRDRIITRPTWLGRAGHAGGAARQLHDRLPAAADPGREAARGPPRRGRAGVRRPALLSAGRASTRARRPDARSSTSTAAAPSTTSRGRARRSSSVLEHNGFEVDRPQAGLLRAAAAVERPVRRRAQGRADAGAALAPSRPRRARRSSSATPPAAR